MIMGIESNKPHCAVEYTPGKNPGIVSEAVKLYLLTLVPSGRITRYDDIVSFVAEKSEVDYVEFDRIINTDWDFWSDIADRIPIHRIVSKLGYVNDFYADKLKSEGLEIEAPKSNKRSPRVCDYKKYLFDFNKETNVD